MRVKVALSSLRLRIGRRGTFLLYLAFLDMASALRFIMPDPQVVANPSYVYLRGIAPLWIWAVLWGVVGLVCLVCAFRVNDAIAFGLAAFLKFLWAATYLIGWVFYDLPQGYFSAVLWGFTAVVVLVISGGLRR